MAIPVMQFQQPTFAQSQPELAAIAGPMSLADQYQAIKQRVAQTALTRAQTAMKQAQLKGVPLDIQLKNLQLQRAPLLNQLTQAQINRLQAQTQAPFGGMKLQGSAADALGLEMLKQKYGENSPIYQNAIKAFNSKIAMQKARSLYYSANVQFKNLPKFQKQQIVSDYQNWAAQQQKIGRTPLSFQDWLADRHANLQATRGPGAGLYGQPAIPTVPTQPSLPVTGPTATPTVTPPVPGAAPPQPQAVVTPPTQQPIQPTRDYSQEARESELAKIKAVAPPKIYNLAVQTQATLETMSRVPPQVFNYASIAGRGRAGLLRAQEQGQILPKDAVRYQTFINEDVPAIADQMRQAFGASVTPQIMKWLREMANPITWKNSPQVALASWNELHQILEDRYKTYLQYAPLSEATKSAVDAGKIPGAPQARTTGYFSTRLGRIVTQQDLNDTVKASGKSLVQVKKDFGIQ